MYCPNCSADLAGRDSTENCWKCDAHFGKGSAWKPVPSPVEDEPIGPFLAVLLRVVMGGVLWSAIAALALLSAVPYGGGSQALFSVWLLATLALPIRALWPLHRLFPGKKVQPEPSEES